MWLEDCYCEMQSCFGQLLLNCLFQSSQHALPHGECTWRLQMLSFGPPPPKRHMTHATISNVVNIISNVGMFLAGSDAAAQRLDSMSEDYATFKQNFYLQYFFPPSSVGETGRTGGMPGRREVGHGMLAQRALAPIVPDGVCCLAPACLTAVCVQ